MSKKTSILLTFVFFIVSKIYCENFNIESWEYYPDFPVGIVEEQPIPISYEKYLRLSIEKDKMIEIINTSEVEIFATRNADIQREFENGKMFIVIKNVEKVHDITKDYFIKRLMTSKIQYGSLAPKEWKYIAIIKTANCLSLISFNFNLSKLYYIFQKGYYYAVNE